jgi:DNA primase
MKVNQETINNIKNLVDPESVLGYLGFNIIKRGSKELRGPCKVHGGDNFTAFRFNLENKTWCCYTRHCEGEKDRDLIGLIQKTTGKNFMESVQLLADMAGVDLNNQAQLSEEFLRLQQKQEMRKEIQRNNRTLVTSTVSEEVLAEFEGQRSAYFSDRGFAKEILDFYEVGGTTDSRGVHRETIPVRNEDGELLTVSMRRTDSDEDPKYVLLKNVSKGETLYNLHVAKHYVGENRTLIIVEGFVDVWALCRLGVYNVVAIMGTDIVPNQARLIWKYAENAIIMLDPDKAGREGVPRLVKMLDKGLNLQVIDLPDGKDPKYLTKEDLEIYFRGV